MELFGANITVSGVKNKEYTGSAITQDITVKENEQNNTKMKLVRPRGKLT